MSILRQPLTIALLLTVPLLVTCCGSSGESAAPRQQPTVGVQVGALEATPEPPAPPPMSLATVPVMAVASGPEQGGAVVDALGPLRSLEGLSSEFSDPDVFVEDPIEPRPGFDDLTAAGHGYVTFLETRIEYQPAGCVASPGATPHGLFAVSVNAPDTAGTVACADYGETVRLGAVAVVFGTQGDDTLGADRIPADAHVLIFGFEGDDTIIPASGVHDNYILAGPGADRVEAPLQEGGHGARIFGGDGNDTLTGTAGRDFIVGGPGNDVITAGDDQDELHGGPGADLLDACPMDLEYDAFIGGDGVDEYKASFLAGHITDTLFDYANPEVVRDCEGRQVAP